MQSRHKMGFINSNIASQSTFTDDYSRFGHVFLLKHKSEAFERFKEYRNEVEKQTGKIIKTLRSDRGGEYLSGEFLTYMRENEILSQVTPPYTPQHNGVSERRNHTLLDMVRLMVSDSGLPISLWGYALQTTAYLLNKVPSKSVLTSPHELWTSRKPTLDHIKVWGYPAYVKRTHPDKLEDRSFECRFIGYPSNSTGYIFYHKEQQNVGSKHVTFLEREFLVKEAQSTQVELDECPDNEPTNEEIMGTVGEPDTMVPQPIRKSTRVRSPDRYYGFLVDGGDRR